MDFEQTFDESYERAIANRVDGQEFFQAFYELFLSESDEIATLFASTDMERQRRMLKKSFYSLLTFYVSHHVDYYLDAAARSHSQANLGIRPELFDLWLEALIKTAWEFDPDFNTQTEEAWRLVMAPGITYMKFNYNCRPD